MRLLFLISAMLLAVGCASDTSTSQVKYYQLTNVPLTTIERDENNTKFTLRLDEVGLRGALNNRGIIMQLPNQQIHTANYHLWADSPSAMLTSNAQMGLLHALPDGLIVKSDALYTELTQQAFYQLNIELNRFNAGLDNNAQVAGLWRLSHVDVNGKVKVLKLQSFNYSTTLEQDGYGALADALSQSWQQVIKQISDTLTKM